MKFFTNLYLRKGLLLFLLVFSASQKTIAQWTSVGPTNGQTVFGSNVAPTQGADYQVLAIDTLTGTPYVAYSELSSSSKIAVKKFDGTNWVFVGTPYFSTGAARYIDLAIDPTGVPYVLYVDGSLGSRSACKKFNGTTWVDVGPATGFNAGNSAFDKLTISKNGTPFVAFVDYSGTLNGRMTAMSFNGTAWVYLGNPGLSTGAGNSCTIKTDANNVPYVAYGHAGNGNKMTVKKYMGAGVWTAVGTDGFSASTTTFGTMAIANDGTIYTAYSDGARANRITVKKFDGTAWVSVGTEGFTANGIFSSPVYKQLSLTIDKNIYPIIAFADAGATNKATAMRFDGTAWNQLGIAGYSNNTNNAKSVTLELYKSTLYSSFVDVTNWRAAVMKFTLCNQPTTPTVAAAQTQVCLGSSTTLSVTSGTLNDATNWVWYAGTCGGTAIGSGTQITVTPTATTTYYVRGEGACAAGNACAPITVTSLPLPTQPFISVVTGGALSSSYTNSNQWSFNGGAIAGATQQTIAPFQTGNYTVTYTNNNGCQSTSLPYAATVNSNVNIDGVDLYPNPAKNYVRIKFPTVTSNFYVTVSSLESKKIMSAQYQNTSLVTLNIEQLQPGVYIVKVFSTDGTNKVFRLVKGN